MLNEALSLPSAQEVALQEADDSLRLIVVGSGWAVEFRSRDRWARTPVFNSFAVAFETYARFL